MKAIENIIKTEFEMSGLAEGDLNFIQHLIKRYGIGDKNKQKPICSYCEKRMTEKKYLRFEVANKETNIPTYEFLDQHCAFKLMLKTFGINIT